MTRKKRVEADAEVAEPFAAEASSNVGRDLRAVLEEIKSFNGVLGYILRNSTSAAIDLKDPSKLIDFAVLSSSAFEVGEETAEVFQLGKVKDVVVEGDKLKVLSLLVKENRVSVFMENSACLDKICEKLLKG